MKKLFLFLILLTFSLSAKELRIGIFSDWQPYLPTAPGAAQTLRDVFTQMKELGVDVIINAGDIAYSGKPEVYRFHQKTFHEIFPENPPALLVVMGNHDFRNRDLKTIEEKYKNFMDNMELKELDFHKVIGGYHFIGFNPDIFSGEGYTNNVVKKVQQEIRKALAASGDRPVFVISHVPAYRTSYGSHRSGKGQVANALRPFQNIIHLAGHTHFPLDDERSIYQQKYTAIGTGTTSYGSLEKGPFNRQGAHILNAKKVQQFLYMTVSEKEIKVRRFSVNRKKEIKPDSPWRIALPLNPATYTYTDARAKQRKAPQFPAQATAKIRNVRKPSPGVVMDFDAAKHDDFVHSYALKISRWDEAAKKWIPEEKEHVFFSDFYLGIEKMKKRFDVFIPNKVFTFQPDCRYQLEIFPIESFGKRGKALITEFTPEKAQ